MADPKTLLVSKGTGTAVPMSVAEYRSLMNSLAPQERRLLTVRGTVQGLAHDGVGHATEEKMTHEQVSARIDRGEDPVLTSDDPRRDVIRGQEQAALERGVAEDAVGTHAAHKIGGVFGAAAGENMALGDEEATQYRQKLLAANRGPGMAIDLMMMAAGGMGAARMVPGLMSTTKGLKGFGNLMALGAGQDTYMYAEYLADNNLPFRAEDYGRTLMTGALINLPLAGMAAVRGAAVQAVGSALESGGDLAGHIATGYNLKTVLASPHSMQAAVAARTAGAFRIISKFGRKLRGKTIHPSTVIDPLEQAEKFAKYQEKQIGRMTPQKLKNMTNLERKALLEEVGGWADVPEHKLGNADFDRMAERINAVDTKAVNLDKQVDNINVKMGDWTHGIGGRASKKQAAAFEAHLGKVVGDLQNAGWGDIGGWLERLLDKGKDGKFLTNPHRQFGKIVKARLDARLKRLTTGGAAQADDALRGLIDDSSVWGKGKHPQRAKMLNEGIDELAEAQIELKGLNQKKHLADIGPGDARRAEAMNKAMDKMRSAYAKIEKAKMLSRKQVEVIEKHIKQAGDAATEATESFRDAARINELRGKAAGNVTERLSRVEVAAQDFRAQSAASAVEEAKRFMGLSERATKLLSKGVDVAAYAPISGVILIRQMQRYEKDLVFTHVSSEIAKMTGSPEYMEDRFHGALGATTAADPDVTNMAAIHASSTIHYLSTALPRPSYSLHGGLEPGSLQKDAFLNKYAAIMDPVSVAHAALEGRATPDMIQALRVTQQAAYAELSNILAESLAQAGPKASRKTINGVQLFLGGLDPLYRGDALIALQSNYAQNQQQDQAINGPTGKFRDTSNPRSGDNAFTFSQRLQSY